jgi:uncharacterized protein (TIRG00374 family)
MKKTFFYIRILLSMALTMFFLWIAFRGADPVELQNTMLRLPAAWFFGLFVLQTFSHVLRAIRWKYLLYPVKKTVSLHGAFSSLMIGFMINGIIPRAGEIARSYVLAKKENIAASSVLSTVILERILDVISFASVLCIVVILNDDSIVIWFPSFSGGAWILEVIGILLLLIFVLLFLKSSIIFLFVKKIAVLFPASSRKKIDGIMDSFLQGFQASSVWKNYGIIALLTCSIWSVYIVLLYLPMKMFSMEHLTLTSAATLQISSGLASAMPTPNGIGSYHSFITFTLMRVFHVAEASAGAYVIYTHAIGYLCTLLIGSAYLIKENIHFVDVVKAEQEE